MNRKRLGWMMLGALAVLIGAALAGCKTGNAELVSMFKTVYAGYLNNNAPDSDANNIGGSAGSGIVDNVTGLADALTAAGVDPADVEAAATSDKAMAALIDKISAEDPEAAKKLGKLLAVRNNGRGLLNITTGDLTYSRAMDAALSALLNSDRSALTAGQKDGKAKSGDADLSGKSGMDVSIPIKQ